MHVKSRDSLYFGNTKEMKIYGGNVEITQKFTEILFWRLHVKLKRLLAIVKISNSLYKIVKSIDS